MHGRGAHDPVDAAALRGFERRADNRLRFASRRRSNAQFEGCGAICDNIVHLFFRCLVTSMLSSILSKSAERLYNIKRTGRTFIADCAFIKETLP